MRLVNTSGAALSPAQMSFYSTAATVIPVMMLGYLVGVAAFARAASRWLDRLGDTVRNGLVEFVEGELAELRATRLGRLIAAVDLFFLNRLFVGVGRRFVAPLLLIVVGVPTAGEISALAALARGHAGHETLVITWLGLGVSGVIVLAPILQLLVILPRPFAAISDALLIVSSSEHQAHTTERSSADGDLDPPEDDSTLDDSRES